MCCSHLSDLSRIISEVKIQKLNDYLYSLSPNARRYITPSRIMKALSINYETSVKIILKLENEGFLFRYYGIRCPECSILLRTADTVEELNFYNIKICYGCDEEIELSENDVIILFKLNEGEFPFELGQQNASYTAGKERTFVAPKEDGYLMFKNMEKSLSIIACNAEHERADRIEKQKSLEADKKYENLALKKYNRNVGISIVLSVIGYILLVFIIIYVYKKYGFNKIAIFATFGSSLIPFTINYIIIKFFPQNMDLLKRKLKVKDYNLNT